MFYVFCAWRTGLNDQSPHIQINETEYSEVFFKVQHRHDNPVTCLECARVNKSIIYVTTLERKAPINKLSRSKTQQVFEEKTSDFFQLLLTRMMRLHPRRLCLFKILFKSFCSCTVYNSLPLYSVVFHVCGLFLDGPHTQSKPTRKGFTTASTTTFIDNNVRM